MVGGGNGASRHPMRTSAMWAMLPRAMPDVPLPMVSALAQVPAHRMRLCLSVAAHRQPAPDARRLRVVLQR